MDFREMSTYMRKSSLLKSIVSGNESETLSNVPVPSNPIEVPNQPGPSITFILKKNAIAAAKTYVNILIPKSCNNERSYAFNIDVSDQIQSYTLS
jgi:hypothetical protein